MDTETLWILRKLAAGEISAQSADRILRALVLLRKSEEGKSTGDLVVVRQETPDEMPLAAQQSIPPEKEQSLSENVEVSVQEVKEGTEEVQQNFSTVEETYSIEDTAPVIQDEAESEAAVISGDVPSREKAKDESYEVEEAGIEQVMGREIEEEQGNNSEDEGLEMQAQEVDANTEYLSIESDSPAVGGPTIANTEEELPQGTQIQSATEEVIAKGEKKSEESVPENILWPESTNERPLLGSDGVGIIEDIPDGIELLLEKAGNVTIQGWSQNHIRAEGKVDSSTVLRTEKSLKIGSENGIVLYVPPTVTEINIASGSGSIDIKNYPNNVIIDSDTGEISISEVNGAITVSSIESRITLENCRGTIALESKSGNIVVRKAPVTRIKDLDVLEGGTEEILVVTEISIKTGSGSVTLTDIGGDMDIETNSGNIMLERCRGKYISVGSNGGEITLRDIADDISLKNKDGNISVDNFSGAVSVESRNSEVSLRNSGDAEIHIESDGGDINIENCYVDVYVNSGVGNVFVSGGNLSFGGMGKIELRMKTGNAYLHCRSFENIRIVIEEGNAEVNMEKLNSGGSGQISVYRGNVTVGVLPSFGCELTAHGPREKMHIELPVEIMEKDKNCLRGTLNGGGSKMEVIAPNGEIRFHALESSYIRSDIGNATNNQ